MGRGDINQFVNVKFQQSSLTKAFKNVDILLKRKCNILKHT